MSSLPTRRRERVNEINPRASRMPRHAANGLNVDHTELLHIGDLEPTDVRGALNVGASAALFGGDNKRYIEKSKANYVFTSWTQFIEQLPSIVA